MYAGLNYKKQYLLQVTDKSLQMFGDTRIKAACNRTGCVFAVRNRVLTRKLRRIQAMRFCIFEIQGPNEIEVEKCNRLIENYFPDYKLRRPYAEKDVAVRLKIGHSTPDNTNLYFMRQRYGLGKTSVGDLQLAAAADAAELRTGGGLAELLSQAGSEWQPEMNGCRQRQRSRSEAPMREAAAAAAAALTAGAGDNNGRRLGFSEREAALKQEIGRLESFLSNLQLV